MTQIKHAQICSLTPGQYQPLVKNLLMPLFLKKNAVLQGIFKRENGPLRHSGKRPIKVGKRLIKEGKRPISANGQFSGTPSWWKTALPKKNH